MVKLGDQGNDDHLVLLRFEPDEIRSGTGSDIDSPGHTWSVRSVEKNALRSNSVSLWTTRPCISFSTALRSRAMTSASVNSRIGARRVMFNSVRFCVQKDINE